MPVITLPDGSKRPFENPVSVYEVAASIGAGLAKAALAGKVDGKVRKTKTVWKLSATPARTCSVMRLNNCSPM